ncbi:MAG: YdjY domain-containing protein [Isosphaeraceae bacterium]
MTPSIALWVCLVLYAQPPAVAKAPDQQLRPDRDWSEMGRSLWYDKKERRVVARARVVLREGVLEHLMCLKGTKEHEAIIATDASPKMIHAALLLTGAEVGHPVQFVPKFEPPAGTTIAIEFQWRQDGQVKRSDARDWVWDEKTKAPLRIDWVFAGSLLYEDPVTKKTRYAADEGDLITVANFASAILDLPIVSSANDADRSFTANTARIPPVGTEVLIYLSPRPARPSEKSGKDAKQVPAADHGSVKSRP